jgi:hypothetical protein
MLVKNLFRRGVEALRQPDRNPRCYDYTEQERLNKVKEWNNRNVWNDPKLANEDRESTYYGA